MSRSSFCCRRHREHQFSDPQTAKLRTTEKHAQQLNTDSCKRARYMPRIHPLGAPLMVDLSLARNGHPTKVIDPLPHSLTCFPRHLCSYRSRSGCFEATHGFSLASCHSNTTLSGSEFKILLSQDVYTSSRRVQKALHVLQGTIVQLDVVLCWAIPAPV